jgi:tryptophan synthase alpha subunit
MTTIEQQLATIKNGSSVGIMTHVVAGCPDLATSEEIVELMSKASMDFIEIQLPFSDPVADGPVMAEANEIALNNQTSVDQALAMTSRLSQKVRAPLIAMTYYNILFKRGVKRFCREAKKAGFQGLIIPDLPLDEAESEGYFTNCEAEGLTPILVASENMSLERIELLGEKAKSGFIYITSRTGITGTGFQLSERFHAFLAKLKSVSSLPLAVGFGISSREDVAKLKGEIELAIIGSAVMKIALNNDLQKEQKLKKIEQFLAVLKD